MQSVSAQHAKRASTTGIAQSTYGGRSIWLNETPASWSICIYTKALGASLSCRIFVTKPRHIEYALRNCPYLKLAA